MVERDGLLEYYPVESIVDLPQELEGVVGQEEGRRVTAEKAEEFGQSFP